MKESEENSEKTEEKAAKVAKNSDYNSYFSEEGFRKKVKVHYKSAGFKLLESVISLYFSFRDSDTPKWAKSVILGALGYFILPIDIIPDFIPIAGFTDDVATIAAAFATVALYVKNEHISKAKKTVIKIFNKNNNNLKEEKSESDEEFDNIENK
jgi:uncharacterized membrane protein YkvA (DUF1232 family)